MYQIKDILAWRGGWPLTFSLALLLGLLASVNMPRLISPTQTGKFVFFAYGVLFIVAIYSIRTIWNPGSFEFRFNISKILLAALVTYIIANRYGIAQGHVFSMRFYELAGLVIMYIVLRSLSKDSSKYLLLAIVISGIVQAVYGNMQLWGYSPSHHSAFKMTGSFFNPGPYAGFLASVFPIALGIYLFNVHSSKFATLKNSKWKIVPLLFKYLPMGGIVVLLLVLPASGSRAAWLAVLVSTLFLIIFRYDLKTKISRFLNTSFKKGLAVVLTLCIVAVSLTGLYLLKKDSADGRLLVWQVTAEMIKDHPVFGVGFDRFQAHYMDGQAAHFKQHPDSPFIMTAGDVNYAFSEPLQFLAEEGIIGLMIVLSIVYLLWMQINLKDPLQVIGVAGMLSILTFSLFSYPTAILPIKANMVMMIVLTLNRLPSKYAFRLKHIEKRSGLGYAFKAALSLTLVLLTYAGLGKVNQLKKGYEDWNNAFATYQIGAYQASLEEYQKALPIFNSNGLFLQHYGKALSMAGKHEASTEILEEAKKFFVNTVIQTTLGDSYKALGKFAQAEEAYTQAWYMVPSRFYPKYLLAKLYDETGNCEAATKTAHELLDKEVKVHSTAIKEIRGEMESLLKKYSKIDPN